MASILHCLFFSCIIFFRRNHGCTEVGQCHNRTDVLEALLSTSMGSEVTYWQIPNFSAPHPHHFVFRFSFNLDKSRELEIDIYWRDWRSLCAVKFLRLEEFVDDVRHGMALQLEPQGVLFAEV